jgi:L-iditol 2-dehydrogenase
LIPATGRRFYLVGPGQLELREEPVPVPGPGEVLVRIEAALTCGTDVKVYRRGGHPLMLRTPTPFGHEMAGAIAAVGPRRELEPAIWKPGDRVVVANSAYCGQCRFCRRGRENLCTNLIYLNGAFADYLLVPELFVERSLHQIPPSVAAPVAALAEPLACVLHGLETVALCEPADVVVYGAGPIGLLFVLNLSSAGHRVVVADPNQGRLEGARDSGAAGVIQIGREGGEAGRVRATAASADGFDLAIEATGSPAGWWDALASTHAGGSVLLFGGCPPGSSVPLDTHHLHYHELTVRSTYHHRPATFRRALEVLAAGTLATERLLSTERPLTELEEALRSMMRKDAWKVVLRP